MVRTNFIYVFDADAKNKLLEMQFMVLKSDDKNNVYIFVNDDNKNFVVDDIPYVISDTLTF